MEKTKRTSGRFKPVSGREFEFNQIDQALKTMWEMLSAHEYSQVESQVIAAMCRDGIAKVEQ